MSDEPMEQMFFQEITIMVPYNAEEVLSPAEWDWTELVGSVDEVYLSKWGPQVYVRRCPHCGYLDDPYWHDDGKCHDIIEARIADEQITYMKENPDV